MLSLLALWTVICVQYSIVETANNLWQVINKLVII